MYRLRDQNAGRTLHDQCPRAFASRVVRLARRFHRDERGVISIMGAFFLILGLALCVVVIDVGHLYLAKRRLQSAVDAAALAATGSPQSADAIARMVLARNGYGDTDLFVQTGTYTADPAREVSARLDAASALTPNAVRVTKSAMTPDFFASIFSSDGESRITATATAARIPSVSFSTGSGLAGLSAGDLNQLLGKLLGTDLSLSLVDYTGLASANVDALGLLDQLASQVNLRAGTYGDLANTDITLGQFIAAAKAELNIHQQGQYAAALQALNILSLQAPQDVSATLNALVDTTLWKTRRIGSVVQQDNGQTVVNLFDVVSAMARLYGAGHLTDLGGSLTVPIANSSVSAYLSAGEPMANVTVASVGAGLDTSQVRLALAVTAADIDLGVARATIRVPVYVQMATGHAEVAAIPCQRDGTLVRIDATPTTVSARIGNVDPGLLSDYGEDPGLPQTAIVSLKILGIPVDIDADAEASVAAGPAQSLEYTQGDIAAGTVKSAGADTEHLLSSLANDLQLSVHGSGLTGLVNNIVSATVMPLLRPVLVSVLSSLDPVVYTLLQAAGLRLGTTSVIVHGVSCGRPTIVG